jgi:hypothetical protein
LALLRLGSDSWVKRSSKFGRGVKKVEKYDPAGLLINYCSVLLFLGVEYSIIMHNIVQDSALACFRTLKMGSEVSFNVLHSIHQGRLAWSEAMLPDSAGR